MTIAIPSYQRCQPLRRLLEALAAELRADERLAEGVEIVVVLDGSTDGSQEMCEALDLPVPLSVRWQPNAGLAAARNTALSAATGDVVLYLDDDMVPGDGLVRRHRAFHERAAGSEFLMGPCLFPSDLEVIDMNRSWADEQYGRLAEQGEVTAVEDCSFANTSGAREAFSALGGFDARFVGWGGEDYEMALRVFAAGIRVAYDHDAVAWHLQQRGIVEFCRSKRDQGRNMVRIAEIHPDQRDVLFPAGRGLRRLRRLRRAPQLLLAALALVSGRAADIERLVTRGRSRRLLYLAFEVNLLAGVVDVARSRFYVDRLVGAG
jgi:glycosyltransferase involved in cell wall biosynthesis